MTITGWIILAMVGLIVIAVGIFIASGIYDNKYKFIPVLVAVGIVVALFFGMHWYFTSTASGKRAVVDQKSNLNNGIERVVNVYTANGDLIASYEGKIDIEDKDGGYLKFDFEGKRYIYYNCFIETIAEIE